MPDDERGSLDLAHEYIPMSYDWMLSRMASAEARVDTLMAQSAAVLVAAVIVVTALNEGKIPVSWPMAAGAMSFALFLAITAVGVSAREFVRLHTTAPGSFVREWPGHEPKSFVDYAPAQFMERLAETQKDFSHNQKTLAKVSERSDWMGWMLIVELLSALLWGALSPIY